MTRLARARLTGLALLALAGGGGVQVPPTGYRGEAFAL
jgi:hypothetical protein